MREKKSFLGDLCLHCVCCTLTNILIHIEYLNACILKILRRFLKQILNKKERLRSGKCVTCDF